MYKGIVFLLMAEFLFTVSTVFSKHLTNTSSISAIEVTFFRFFLGIFVAAAIVYHNKISLVSKKPSLLIWRGILNTVAVMLFFLASQFTTITNTHMLNMTYPFFIFLFSPLFFKKEKKQPLLFPILLAALIGIWLVIQPDFNSLRTGDLLALASAVVAAFSIMTLNLARRNESTPVILFYLMAIGTLVNGAAMAPVFVMPQKAQWLWLIGSGALGVAGQVCITYGYKYITARAGSLVSTSRILYAVLLGMMVFGEALSWRIVAGGMLITLSIVAVTLLQKPVPNA